MGWGGVRVRGAHLGVVVDVHARVKLWSVGLPSKKFKLGCVAVALRHEHILPDNGGMGVLASRPL